MLCGYGYCFCDLLVNVCLELNVIHVVGLWLLFCDLLVNVCLCWIDNSFYRVILLTLKLGNKL